jgi:hypothetical protein
MSPNAGGWGVAGVSANEYSCAHGAQINFGDLTPYLTYDCTFLSACLEQEKKALLFNQRESDSGHIRPGKVKKGLNLCE